MTDDNSILDAPVGCKDSLNVSEVIESTMMWIQNTFDPSAIISPNAIREFGQTQHHATPGPPPQQEFTKTPRRDAPSAVRANPLLMQQKKPKFQFSKPSRSFMDMTTFRPQEVAVPRTVAAEPPAASFTDNDYEGDKEDDEPITTEEELLDILPNTSTLTMDFTDDERQMEPVETETAPDDTRTPAAEKRMEEDILYGEQLHDGMNPYDGLLRVAAKNILIMEKMRDEICQLRVQNAMLINDLNMVSFDSYSNDGADLEA